MNRFFEEPEIQVEKFTVEDVITTSGMPERGPDDTEWLP